MRRMLSLALGAAFLAALAQPPPQDPSASATETRAKSPPPCRNDRPLEEYLAELKKAKKQRNKNPLPTGACIGRLCLGKAEMPQPEKSPPPPPPQSKSDSGGSESSSRENVEAAAQNELPDRDPLAVAQSVEVGDYYFSAKNYRAALSRYQEALESKPDDPAIYLRLGRAFDKLGEATRAFESYDASLVADPAAPSAEEARKGAVRLRPELEKRGDDPAAITARNRSRIVPVCPGETSPHHAGQTH
jgi:tetratricopeptide (TPR) repeat protein